MANLSEKVSSNLILPEENSHRRKSSLSHNRNLSSFEKLLEAVDSNGLYQKRLIGWFMLPLSFLYGLPASNFILIVSTPEHNCYVPGQQDVGNITSEEWKNMTLPWETGLDGSAVYSSCKMYNVTPEMDSDGMFVIDEDTKVDCQYGWEYSKDTWKSTVVTDFDWVCDDREEVTKMLTLLMISMAIGTFAFAILSDKYGRKPIFYAVLFLCVVFGSLMTVAQSPPTFAIFTFLMALAFYTLYQMPFLIVMELCSEKLRSFTVISSFTVCILAICLVSLISWLVAEWKKTQLIFFLPMGVFFFYWKFIPESPRWLLSRGKINEFKKTMRNIARINGKELTEDFDVLILQAEKEEQKKVSVLKLITSPVLRKHLLIVCLVLSMSYMFFVGISMNIHNMTGNTFVNFFILSLFEIPGNVIGSLMHNYFGRRITAVVLLFVSGISILITTAYLTQPMTVAVCCGIAKMFACGMVLAVYTQIGELFPTPLRATAYGVTGIVGLAANIVVPSLMALGKSKANLPYYILFSFCVIGTIGATFLPETLGLPMPQTIDEVALIGKHQSYFSLIYKGNAHKLRSSVDKKSSEMKNMKQPK